jgi:L-alanine-DL-glutamate epimerase-like enolase superfamily enzyme
MTEAILIKIESEEWLIGYGEGCPRSYVTGETIETAQRFFENNKADIIKIENLDSIKEWILTNQKTIDQNPAAWCAIELALLDLLGKETRQSVESLLSLPELSDSFQYTAVLGASGLESYRKQLQQYTDIGFKDYKVKVTGDLTEDRKRIEGFNGLGKQIRVRLDANNLWETAEQAIDYIKALDCPLFAIEEPLRVNDHSGCRTIYDVLKMPVILDESFLGLEQFSHIADDPEKWIINLRISKMGGILRSLTIAEKAETLNIPVIIGAQVGETSILTRAALTVANAYRDILLTQEGAFGTHLLKNDIVAQPIMFGKEGQLNASHFANQYGFGVKCDL